MWMSGTALHYCPASRFRGASHTGQDPATTHMHHMEHMVDRLSAARLRRTGSGCCNLESGRVCDTHLSHWISRVGVKMLKWGLMSCGRDKRGGGQILPVHVLGDIDL